MAYDLLIKNGKIAEIGKLSGPAKRTIDAAGQVVAPGFVDNHCHYDAQVTWDPLCSFSPDHGCTTVVFGNCSLALAPVRPGAARRGKARGRVSVLCRSDPDGRPQHCRSRLGDDPPIHEPARPESRGQCR